MSEEKKVSRCECKNAIFAWEKWKVWRVSRRRNEKNKSWLPVIENHFSAGVSGFEGISWVELCALVLRPRFARLFGFIKVLEASNFHWKQTVSQCACRKSAKFQNFEFHNFTFLRFQEIRSEMERLDVGCFSVHTPKIVFVCAILCVLVRWPLRLCLAILSFSIWRILSCSRTSREANLNTSTWRCSAKTTQSFSSRSSATHRCESWWMHTATEP